MIQSKPIENKHSDRAVIWPDVEIALKTLQPVEGGYSDARRGIITLGNGEKVFVKIGVSERTKAWAAKEIKAYGFLAENFYSYIPSLLCINEDKTGFVLEALLPENGWDWSDTWSNERLNATLAATDALAAINPSLDYSELVKPVITDKDNGWLKLVASEELQSILTVKLKESEEADLISKIRIHAEKSSDFKVRHDTLVHDDIRADNCPWNESTRQVKLVDWNWLELGDRRLDLSAMLVHVQDSGFDVLPHFADRLDAEALHWMAGFWLEAASKPIWPGGPEKLRDVQLRSGITALRLAEEMG